MVAGSRSDYFAFGSNLQLAQMAERCPSSLFRGKATLLGWKWQINERGVANIVESQADHVEGLVFSVNIPDMRSLDRSEGVRRDLYERRILSVELDEISNGPWKTAYVARQLQERHCPPVHTNAKLIKALVYVSSRWILSGKIRLEYLERMDRAMADAAVLGVSRQYIGRYVIPFLNGSVMLPEKAPPAQQHQLVEQRALAHHDGVRRQSLQGTVLHTYWPSAGQDPMTRPNAASRQPFPEGMMLSMRLNIVHRMPVPGNIPEDEGQDWSRQRAWPRYRAEHPTTEPLAAKSGPPGYSSDSVMPTRRQSRRHKRSQSADPWPTSLVRDRRNETCHLRKGRSTRYYFR